jgi:hypothetical protein
MGQGSVHPFFGKGSVARGLDPQKKGCGCMELIVAATIFLVVATGYIIVSGRQAKK